jgi:hypothetical protein
MFTRVTQCMRDVLDPPVSTFSLSLYRHPFLYTLFSSRFTLTINNKTVSGVQSAQSKLGPTCFHFRRVAVQVKMWTPTRKGYCFTCYPQFRWCSYHISFSHSPITFTKTVINLVSIFRCSSSKTNSVYTRHVNSLVLGCSLS